MFISILFELDLKTGTKLHNFLVIQIDFSEKLLCGQKNNAVYTYMYTFGDAALLKPHPSLISVPL